MEHAASSTARAQADAPRASRHVHVRKTGSSSFLVRLVSAGQQIGHGRAKWSLDLILVPCLLGQTCAHQIRTEPQRFVHDFGGAAATPSASLKTVTYASVGAAGFLGVRERDVAIPVGVEHLVEHQVLRGATREALRAMPAFGYTT